MEIGFTGTREGMTFAQKETVLSIVAYALQVNLDIRAHHGDCIGADKDFHTICKQLMIPVKGHPPKKEDYRAFCEFDEIAPEKSYYARNRDIVNESEILIATPKESSEQPNGGTWYTVGYAITTNNNYIIVWPDGKTKTVSLRPGPML